MKRYTSRESIIKDIDAAHRKIAKAKQVAQEHLDTEELLTGTGEVQELRAAREAADKQFRKIKRLEAVRLKQLGEALSEFDTFQLKLSDTLQGTTSESFSTPPDPAAA